MHSIHAYDENSDNKVPHKIKDLGLPGALNNDLGPVVQN